MIVAPSIFLKVMKEKILQRLKAIESRYDVKVLLAVESGSRAWDFAEWLNSPIVYYRDEDFFMGMSILRDRVSVRDLPG